MNNPTKDVWNGDYKCINIECDRSIPPHYVEKQFTSPKHRVCTKCRNYSSVRWKCLGCDNILNNNDKRMGGFYCSSTCRVKSNFERKYVKKVKPTKPAIVKSCVYCEKILTKSNAIKFCNEVCFRKNRILEKHKSLYQQDMIKRSNMRHTVKHPNADIEKRDKHRGYQQFYHRRWYNVKKLVASINNKRNI